MSQAMANVWHGLLLTGLEAAMMLGLTLLHRWKRRAIELYQRQTTAAERQWLQLVGVEAFHYAERVFRECDGPAKLNEAVKYVLDRTSTHGVDVTYSEIRAVIERAWSEAKA